MKRINAPLTDIHDRDFITGEIVKNERFEEMQMTLEGKVKNWVRKKRLNARADGKIFVEGLGYVSL